MRKGYSNKEHEHSASIINDYVGYFYTLAEAAAAVREARKLLMPFSELDRITV
jgi:hypothetical protein